MERKEKGKGIATPVASLFSAEEAEKAAQKVNDSIAERQKDLDQLNAFIADNNALKKLVQKLPHELSHDIVVLLGEGYYAERIAKQTVEIPQRRGKTLQSQVEALKAVDLQAEASFFNSTAAEAAEGLVKIREDYYEEHSLTDLEPELESLHSSKDVNDKKLTHNEEFDRLMSRLDELEKEEDQAGNSSGSSDEDRGPEMSVTESQLEYVDLSTIRNRSTQGIELEKLQLHSFDKGEPSNGNDGAVKPRKFDERKILSYPRKEEKCHVSFAPRKDVSDVPVEDNTSRRTFSCSEGQIHGKSR